MSVKIQKIENSKQKIICIGLIVSDQFCKEILPILKTNKELLKDVFSNYYRIVIYWIIDYYDNYKTSPKQDIQKIYEKESETLDETEADLIRQFLVNLNNKYEREDNFNELYAIDQSKLFLRKSNLSILQKKIKENIADNKIEQAEEYIDNFRQIKKETETYQVTDIFKDIDEIAECPNVEEVQLFKYPGILGKRLGYFVRGDFFAITAPGKRGKSWSLEELAVLGLLFNNNVVVFNLEMEHIDYEKRLCQNFLGEVEYVENRQKGYDIIEVPYFEQSGDKWRVKVKREEKTGISSQAIKRKLKQLKLMQTGGLKIFTFPSGSFSVRKAEQIIDDLFLDGFVADVIIVDYADIMISSDREEYRHKINSIWRDLRGLAQKKHCLVATASHSNKSTFKKDVSQSDVSEDYRKYNHVTKMIGLNQVSEDIENNVMRINIMANRKRRFNPEEFFAVLYKYEIGKSLLDCKLSRDVIYSNSDEFE